MEISLIASSVRYELYEALFESLKGTSIKGEVVFVGNRLPRIQDHFPDLRYIETKNIKPAQCYEIARREAKGKLICWCADDCQFPNDVLGSAFRYWEAQENRKLVLSMLTRERYDRRYTLTNLDVHRLKGQGTPLMAPINLMDREYLEELGGFDRRYLCGQYENDVIMRVYADGGELEKFEKDAVIIDHWTGHGGVTTAEGHKRPFASGYPHDRRILEGSWIKNGAVQKERLDEFEPYEEKDLRTKSQSEKGRWV